MSNNPYTVTVRVESIYGRFLVYPVCANAMKFCELFGSKTLTPEKIQGIKDLGFEIIIQQEQVVL